MAELQKDEDLLDQVVGLFFGEKKDQDSSTSYIFQSVEERVSGDSSKITVGKMGLKEGKNEVLYMGFKSKDGGELFRDRDVQVESVARRRPICDVKMQI